MPVLGRFSGVVVFINYLDHEPPHFHARFEDEEILVEIQSGLVRGVMSKQALRLVLDWMDIHDRELRENWVRVRDRKPFEPIAPQSVDGA